MIIIEVIPSRDETTAIATICAFQASMSNVPFNIEGSLPYIETAIKDLGLDIACGASDISTVEVAYDPIDTSWKLWYIQIIDAIKAYVAANCPRHSHEILSRVRRP